MDWFGIFWIIMLIAWIGLWILQYIKHKRENNDDAFFDGFISGSWIVLCFYMIVKAFFNIID